jgi:hypothetical protein
LLSMPSLETLFMTLSEEEEEEVVVALPRLMFLNGTPLTFPEDELAMEGSIVEQQGIGQHASPPQPQQAHSLQYHQEKHYELPPAASQPPVPPQNVGFHSSSGHRQAHGVVNTSKASPGRHSGPGSETVALTQDDLERVAVVFGEIKNLQTSSRPTEMTQTFDRHVQMTVNALSQQLHAMVADDAFGKQCEILRAKYQLYEVCFEQAISAVELGACSGVGSHAHTAATGVGSVLRHLRQVHDDLFDDFPSLVHRIRPHYEQRCVRLEAEKAKAEEETSQLLEAAELLEKENEAHSAENLRLRQELQRVLGENSELRRAHHSTTMQLRMDNSVAAPTDTDQAARTLPREEQASDGARQQQQSMNAHSNLGGSIGILGQSGYTMEGMNASSSSASTAGNVGGRLGTSSTAGTSSTGGVKSAQQYSSTRATGGEKQRGGDRSSHALGRVAGAATGMNASAGTGVSMSQAAVAPVRNISLKQLKDHIEGIYTSKLKFDQKCSAAHLPRETLEQHMYTYLNQRYGLKALIVEHASAIIKAVNKCSAQDNDVAVFGKILRNEVDEEFRFVQQQLKQTVKELLRVYLKGKHPMKRDSDIGEMLERRVNQTAGVEVQEEEWTDIIKYMYNHQDSLSLVVMVKDLCRQRAKQQQHSTMSADDGTGRRRKMTGDTAHAAGSAKRSEAAMSIPFQMFLKVLLDFQLHGHDRFLAPFRVLFRQVDADRNGVVNEHEFRLLLRKIDSAKSEEEIGAMLSKVDPYDNQHITFSESVTCLSSELLLLSSAGAGGKHKSAARRKRPSAGA